MIISFDVPNPKLTRIGDALPMVGYVFDPELGTTDTQQKIAFLKVKTIQYWTSMVHDCEKRQALQAAEAGVVLPDLNDIS